MKLNLSKSTVYMQTAKNVFSPAQYYTMCIMYTIHVYLYIKKKLYGQVIPHILYESIKIASTYIW